MNIAKVILLIVITVLLFFGLFRYESYEGSRWKFVELTEGLSRNQQLTKCMQRYQDGAPFAQRPGKTPMQTTRALCDVELNATYKYHGVKSRISSPQATIP